MPVNGVNGRQHTWTHEEAIEAGRRWVERFGSPPTRRELDPALMRRQLRRAEAKVAELRERVERFVPGEIPGAETISRLFGGRDAYLHALGFTPRGTGRPPKRLAGEHAAQAERVIES